MVRLRGLLDTEKLEELQELARRLLDYADRESNLTISSDTIMKLVDCVHEYMALRDAVEKEEKEKCSSPLHDLHKELEDISENYRDGIIPEREFRKEALGHVLEWVDTEMAIKETAKAVGDGYAEKAG